MSSAYGRELNEGGRTADLHFSVKSRMMDLRKATNHPYLIEYPLTEDGVYYRVDDDLVEICGKMKVLDQMLTALIARDHKILIFSQMTRMLDIIQDFLNFKVTNELQKLVFSQVSQLSRKNVSALVKAGQLAASKPKRVQRKPVEVIAA